MSKDYRVFWSEEDQEWIAHPIDEPSFSWLDTTPETALLGLLHLEQELGNE